MQLRPSLFRRTSPHDTDGGVRVFHHATTLAVAAIGVAAIGCVGSADARATTVPDALSCARGAIGGDAVTHVRSLLIRKVRNPAAGAKGGLRAEEHLAIALPDRYREEVRSDLPNYSLISIRGFKGDVPFERSTVNGESSSHAVRPEALKAAKQQFARELLVWLIRDSPAFPLQWALADSNKVPTDRPSKRVPANRLALGATGPEGFNATLLLDAITCHPVALTYERRATIADFRAEQANGISVVGDTRLERLDLSDYRSFGGVMFPTRIKMSIGPRAISDERVTEIEVNPALPADEFR